MKKYRVENAFMNAEQIKGNEEYDPRIKDCYVGDYITATCERNAIEIAIEPIINELLHNSTYFKVQRKNDEIRCFDREGVELERYFDFTATPVFEETYCVEHSKKDYLNEYFDDGDEALKKAREIKEQMANGEEDEEEISVTYGIMRDGDYSAEETIC